MKNICCLILKRPRREKLFARDWLEMREKVEKKRKLRLRNEHREFMFCCSYGLQQPHLFGQDVMEQNKEESSALRIVIEVKSESLRLCFD